MSLLTDRTVHVLSGGFPLCGFSKSLPRDWPKHNYWVSIADKTRHKMVNCTKCKEKLKK